jgi:hypothetical protein
MFLPEDPWLEKSSTIFVESLKNTPVALLERRYPRPYFEE